MLRLPPAARSDALDPVGDVLVALLPADRSHVARRRAVRVPGRDRADVSTIDDFATHARDAPALRGRVGAEALLLRELGGVRPDRSGVPADRRRLQERLVVERRSSRELLSSPITTNAVATHTTTTNGEVVAVSRARPPVRRAQQAARLRRRRAGSTRSTEDALTPIAQIVGGLPSDGYGRGAPIPVLAERSRRCSIAPASRTSARPSRTWSSTARRRPSRARRRGRARTRRRDRATSCRRHGARRRRPARGADDADADATTSTTPMQAGRHDDRRAASRRSSRRACRPSFVGIGM